MDVHERAQGYSEMQIPPRSRLYCLSPLGVGTLWTESLTSYINRLAWTYRVSPRVLVAQEVVPQLERGWSSATVLVVEIMLIGKQIASLEESLPTDYRETTGA